MSSSASRPRTVVIGLALCTSLTVPTVVSADVATAVASELGAPVVRINSGGGALTDAAGRAWRADSYVTGGSTWDSGRLVDSATPEVDRNERVGDSRYAIPVPSRGDYVVRLHLTENYWNSVGQRIFDISAEGSTVARGVDILTTHRKYQTKLVDARRTVTDGVLNVEFKTVKTGASVTAIEVFHAAVTPAPVTSPTPASEVAALPGAMQSVVGTGFSGTDTLVLSDRLPVPNGSPAVTGIRRTRNDPTGRHGGPWSAVDSPTSTSRTFLGLVPGAEYELTTAAVNANGTGPSTTVKVKVGASGTVTVGSPVTAPTEPAPTSPPPVVVGAPTTTSKGSLPERAHSRSYALTGLQAGTSGDPVANGNRMRAVLAAAQPGDLITVAPGHYRLAGNVEFTVPNVTLKGLGASREDVWFEHTTQTRAIFMVKAGGVHFYNFTHRVHGTARSSLGQSGEGNIWVQGGHSGFRMQDVLAWGSRDAAIFLYGVHNFELNRVESRDSRSDCYHVSKGSSYGTWYDSKSTNCGDDGIGFVGYGGEGPGTPHHHKVVRHHVAKQSPNGRGIGIIHVNNIEIYGPTLIEDSWGAGIILAREPQYGSGGIRAIRIYGELRLRRANSAPGIVHGAIHIHNPDGTAPIEDVLITGPVVAVDTGKNRGGVPFQVRAHGAGRIQAEIRDMRFYGSGPATKLSLSLAGGSSVITPGWSNSTPYIATEPAFPIG